MGFSAKLLLSTCQLLLLQLLLLFPSCIAFDSCNEDEFKIADSNSLPPIAAPLGENRFIVFGQWNYTLFAAVYGDATLPIFSFTIEKTTQWDAHPTAAYLGNDMFVVAWQDVYNFPTIQFKIYGQMYHINGMKAGPQFLISGPDDVDARFVGVAYVEPGIFGASWTNVTANTGAVVSSYFLVKSASRYGDVVQVNNCNCYQTGTVVAAVNGTLMTAWQRQMNRYFEIYAQGSKSDGSLVDSLLSVDFGYTWSKQTSPSVVALNESKYAVAWISAGQGVEFHIRVQIVQKGNNKMGYEILVNPNTTFHYNGQVIIPAIAALNSGKDFVVGWQHQEQNGVFEIYGQIISSAGEKIGNIFKINKITTNDTNVVIVPLGGSRFAAVFSRPGEKFWGIYVRKLASTCFTG